MLRMAWDDAGVMGCPTLPHPTVARLPASWLPGDKVSDRAVLGRPNPSWPSPCLNPAVVPCSSPTAMCHELCCSPACGCAFDWAGPGGGEEVVEHGTGQGVSRGGGLNKGEGVEAEQGRGGRLNKAEPGAEPTKGKGKATKAKPAPQPGRWLDRDCNAALNMQRIGESRWRPLELCFWPEQGRLPAKGKEYPGLGYKRLRDKLPQAQQQQPPAVAQ
ncbi:hypothetical protein QJQ45_000018 [Haematococcus lacustris]|nr:hypothetical protein QJQ45_000018 [Haematococcus lacustris]